MVFEDIKIVELTKLKLREREMGTMKCLVDYDSRD